MKSSDIDFGIFDYKLPPLRAEEYASAALSILSGIKNEFPEFYDNFKSPSEVLTLSGVRAFDTYYDFGTSTPPERIQELQSFLLERGIVLLEDDEANIVMDAARGDNPYSLVHIDAFSRIKEDYSHAEFTALKKEMLVDPKSFFLWWSGWKQKLLSSKNEDVQNLSNQDAWSPHNITFGMLLGYPGEAIVSIWLYENDSCTFVGARIMHHDKYDGAHPQYDYIKTLSTNQNIIAHETLWSSILDQVYAEIE